MRTDDEVLSPRALNRATLARQFLLDRSPMTPSEMIEHLVGMQAQAPFPPYFGLWTRLRAFRPDDLVRLLQDRSVVRIVLMRGTVHLVSAADCLALRPLTQPILDQDLRRNPTVRPALDGVDLPALAAATRALLDDAPRTIAELRPLLVARWPGRDAAALCYAARNLLPLVQLPPRAIWGSGGQPSYATAQSWLGRELHPDPSLDDMVLRYLAAFGPATAADATQWCGLTGLRAVFERLRPGLRTFRDERGRELFDLPDAPRPDPRTPAPVRFLPEFDNLLLSHADRSRVIADGDRPRLASKNGMVPATVLVNGAVRGTWKIVRERTGTDLVIEPFRAFPQRAAAAARAEGARLLTFATTGDADAPPRDVRLRPPSRTAPPSSAGTPART